MMTARSSSAFSIHRCRCLCRRICGHFSKRFVIPLAVRSSSLLEDSQYQPFTGVYETFMLGNQQADVAARFNELCEAIKRVYASTFSQHAKAYVRATPYRLEEEKMAVILQQVVGTAHGTRFYPDFSGVVRSHNFYPIAAHDVLDDGIAAVALGLGRTVVDGGKCLSFCPRYPRNLLQFSSVEDILANTQTEFWALELDGVPHGAGPGHLREVRFGLDVAEADGTLHAVASTYSADNNAVYDGLSRPGARVVTFAPMLKHGIFPLANDSGSAGARRRRCAGQSGGDRIRSAPAAGRGARRISDFCRSAR